MNTIFAPDYRHGNPYQEKLANALQFLGCNVDFLSNYRRGFPLYRLTRTLPGKILHIHWPEKYFRQNGLLDFLRHLRFPLDLSLAKRKRKLVVTAHNLYPHACGRTALSKYAISKLFKKADGVITHCSGSINKVTTEFQLTKQLIHVIPHGDLADGFPTLTPKLTARSQLGLSEQAQIFLMFGAIAPYKGLSEVIDAWAEQKPRATLLIAGSPSNDAYLQALQNKVIDTPGVKLIPKFLTSRELAQYLASADACLFNYQTILTSGAAALARSLGIPILLPAHLGDIGLDEPDPTVIRFSKLKQLLKNIPPLHFPNHDCSSWRKQCSWENVAQRHIDLYREL